MATLQDATRILYGGSVGPDTVDGLLDEEDIDGALVGGASLSADKFARIINFEPVKMGKRKRLRNLVQKVVSKLANS
jgi:triosephosphate isomerase